MTFQLRPNSVRLLAVATSISAAWAGITPPAARASASCAEIAPHEVYRILVSSQSPGAGYDELVTDINGLAQALAARKAEGRYRRFEVELAPGVHALQAPLSLQAHQSPECGIGLRSQSDELATLRPAGSLQGWSAYSGDIVRTIVPAGMKVTGLSYDGQLLLRSRFPRRDIERPVGTILELDGKKGAFQLESHESSRQLLKAFSSTRSENEGDPQIWIPGTGSIYTFDIVRAQESKNGVAAVAGNDLQHRTAFKCMEYLAQNKLSAQERKACRLNPGNSNLAHKEVWRGIKPHHPFFLENHVEFISAPGEWAFDARTRALYLKMPRGATLASLNARGVNFVNSLANATRMQNLLSVNTVPHFSLEGIRFEGATFVHQEPIFAMARGAVSTAHLIWNPQQKGFEKKGLFSAIDIRNSGPLTFRRNEFSGFDGVGVTISGGAGHQIESNLFREIGFSSFEMSRVSDTQVRNNVFRDIGVRGVGDALRVSGLRLRIENNDIRNSSRGGVQVAGAWCGEKNSDGRGTCNILVRGNALRDVITGGLTDYGAIYLNSISHDQVSPQWNRDNPNVQITGNYVEKVRIAGFYPPQFEIEGPTGIYLDSGSKKVLVSGNELDLIDNALNQNCSDANRFFDNRITRSREILKSFKKYGSEKDWVEKCVAVDRAWAKLKGLTELRNNDSSAPRVRGAGLVTSELQYWRSRGVYDLFSN
jgi:hypothetical protein